MRERGSGGRRARDSPSRTPGGWASRPRPGSGVDGDPRGVVERAGRHSPAEAYCLRNFSNGPSIPHSETGRATDAAGKSPQRNAETRIPWTRPDPALPPDPKTSSANADGPRGEVVSFTRLAVLIGPPYSTGSSAAACTWSGVGENHCPQKRTTAVERRFLVELALAPRHRPQMRPSLATKSCPHGASPGHGVRKSGQTSIDPTRPHQRTPGHSGSSHPSAVQRP